MDATDDPLTMVSGTAMGIGTLANIGSSLQEGEDLEAISEQRAMVDEANAEAAMRRANAAALMKFEQGKRVISSQKASFAAGNVRVNVGSPVVLEAATRDAIMKDVGYILEGGGAQQSAYLASAGIERATGKMYKRKSKWDALTAGLGGVTSIAMLGAMGGWGGDEVPEGSGLAGWDRRIV